MELFNNVQINVKIIKKIVYVLIVQYYIIYKNQQNYVKIVLHLVNNV